MNVTLPDELRAELLIKADAAGHLDVGAYLAQLVRNDGERVWELDARQNMKFSNRAELESCLKEGLESGDPVEATPDLYEEIHARVLRRIAES